MILLLVGAYSCSVLEIRKEVEFDIVFPVSGDEPMVQDSYLFDLMQYSAEYEEYMDQVQNIDISSITVTVTDFIGPEDQYIHAGELLISDENGSGTQLLAVIPELALAEVADTEKELDLQPAGLDRAEELILNSPNTCLSTVTVQVSPTPADFKLIFHVKAVVTGTLL